MPVALQKLVYRGKHLRDPAATVEAAVVQAHKKGAAVKPSYKLMLIGTDPEAVARVEQEVKNVRVLNDLGGAQRRTGKYVRRPNTKRALPKHRFMSFQTLPGLPNRDRVSNASTTSSLALSFSRPTIANAALPGRGSATSSGQ